MIASPSKKRIQLCKHIVHYRLMVKWGYHPDFFQKLINKALSEQRSLIKQEKESKDAKKEGS